MPLAKPLSVLFSVQISVHLIGGGGSSGILTSVFEESFILRVTGNFHLMGARRRSQIEEALSNYIPNITRKLSDEQVIEILSTPFEVRGTQKALATKYRVSRWTIRNVLERKDRFVCFE